MVDDLYDYDTRLAATWAALPRNEHGLVVFEAPGLGSRLADLLDLLAPLASDPTLLDDMAERFLRLTRQAELDPGPKIDADKFNVESDFKFSAQAGISTPQVMRAFASLWPHDVLEVFELLEEVRRFMYLLLVNTVQDPWWSEKRQSIRATRYYPGLHSPQQAHVDPPVVAMVLLPPGDDHLMVKVEGLGWQTVVAGNEPTVVAFPGSAAAQVIPGAKALDHAVAPLRNRQCRDVATLFVG